MSVHVMVDLETWGLTPGSDIRSIGAVEFDPRTGALGDEFYVNVTGGNAVGLTRDPSTEKWWSEQSDAAQTRLGIGIRDLHSGLTVFANWWKSAAESEQAGGDYVRFWAHGPHFDEAILAAAFRACGISVPWHYRAPRDCRTIFEAAGQIEVPFQGVEHDALDDAKHQARCVAAAYQRLTRLENPNGL